MEMKKLSNYFVYAICLIAVVFSAGAGQYLIVVHMRSPPFFLYRNYTTWRSVFARKIPLDRSEPIQRETKKLFIQSSQSSS